MKKSQVQLVLREFRIPFAYSGKIKTFFLKSEKYPDELLRSSDNGFRFELDVEEQMERVDAVNHYRRIKMPIIQRILINRSIVRPIN